MRGNLIVMFVTAVCFSFPFFPSYPANIDWFYYTITKIHPPFQNPGSAPAGNDISCRYSGSIYFAFSLPWLTWVSVGKELKSCVQKKSKIHNSKLNWFLLGDKIRANRLSLFGACSLSIYKNWNETTEKASTTNRPWNFKATVPLISSSGSVSSGSVEQEKKSSYWFKLRSKLWQTKVQLIAVCKQNLT